MITGSGLVPHDFLEEFDPAHPRHSHVGRDHVGLEPRDLVARIAAESSTTRALASSSRITFRLRETPDGSRVSSPVKKVCPPGPTNAALRCPQRGIRQASLMQRKCSQAWQRWASDPSIGPYLHLVPDWRNGMNTQNRFVLPALCDRGAAEALLPELVAAIGAGRIEIDASGTTRMGQAMLQILVSARQTDRSATITRSPEPIEAARPCGLGRVLFDEVLP